ncbi:SIR2 family protein [Legionella sainthelensi]|uniref:SIR2 family protein n=1 Tax=Legionella sainthelensi TaxID=28087 RepID=UPI000E200FE2|nr:SIR2 family protein [Legionella sainthelensi]
MTNRILLTGAGFTHNFGTPLAKEIATHISNSLEGDEGMKLKKIIREYEYDYENAYQDIIAGEYSKLEQLKMYSALSDAYKFLDNIVNNLESEHTINLIENELIKNLQMNYYGSGFIFTLNQDLFIERRCRHRVDVQYCLPAANTQFLKIDNINKVFDKELCSENNDQEKINQGKNYFLKKLDKIRNKRDSTPLIAYVKLHGSMDWISDGENQLMVIGGNKTQYISKFPLLTWYYELFQNELNNDNAKLLIIGYSFIDEHINLVIKEAIEAHELKLYIINPTKQVDFEKELITRKFGNQILDAISGYYPYSLKELFPNDNNQPITAQWETIKSQFFLS